MKWLVILRPFPLDQDYYSSFIAECETSFSYQKRIFMKKLILLFTSFFFLFVACSPQSTSTPQSTEPQTITIMTHDSFAVSEEVVKSFEEANNAKVTFLQSGDAGAVLNKAILTKDAPLADVLFGVDNTFLSRALEGDIFEAYESPALVDIDDSFKLDA